MSMEDWDLHAVVRGCTTTSTTTARTSATTNTATTIATYNTSVLPDFGPQPRLSSFGCQQNGHLFSLPHPFEASRAMEELHELYKPFFPKSQPPLSPQCIFSTPISPLSSSLSPVSTDQLQIQRPLKPPPPSPPPQQQQQPKQSQVNSSSAANSTTATSHTPRSKRKKNQLKKVCQVPAEALSSDIWAWRKYGQKPIKGSPYPRGYYRCSSSKGCLARKQVERNRSDPGMFIVTYTAEHNHPAPTHRNSLAGSTRQKPFTPQTATAGDSNKSPTPKPSNNTASCSSPATSTEEEPVQQSTNTQSREEDKEMMEDDDEVEFGASDTVVSDDFFEGLEGLVSPVNGGDCLSGYFPASFGFPWLTNKAATTAGGV